MAGRGLTTEKLVTVGDLDSTPDEDVDLSYLSVPRWDDLRFPATGARIDVSSGRLDYDYAECGINFQSNARYDNEPLCMVAQMPHSKKLGTEVRPHIHWDQNQAATPNWLLEWRWVNNGEQRGTWQQEIYTNNLYTYLSGNLQQLTEFPALQPPLNESVSSLLEFRVFRDSNNSSGLFAGADPYSGSALFKEFDLHYQIDSFGSPQEYTK